MFFIFILHLTIFFINLKYQETKTLYLSHQTIMNYLSQIKYTHIAISTLIMITTKEFQLELTAHHIFYFKNYFSHSYIYLNYSRLHRVMK